MNSSFYKILRHPMLEVLVLPKKVRLIIDDNHIVPGTKKIATNSGLSWDVELIFKDNKFLFQEGWLNVVKQLYLTKGCYLVFTYDENDTFLMSFFHDYQWNSITKSFYVNVLNTKTDMMLVPQTFFEQNFGFNKVPKRGVKVLHFDDVVISRKNEFWMKWSKLSCGLFVLSGMRKLIEEVPLEYGDLVIMTLDFKDLFRMAVYNNHGVEKFPCGHRYVGQPLNLKNSEFSKSLPVVLSSTPNFNSPAMKTALTSNFRKENNDQSGLSNKRKTRVEECESSSRKKTKVGGQGLFSPSKSPQLVLGEFPSFVKQVESRLRLYSPFVKECGFVKGSKVMVTFDDGEPHECVVGVESNGESKSPRYILNSWKEFVEEKGLELGWYCKFTYHKVEGLLKVSREE